MNRCEAGFPESSEDDRVSSAPISQATNRVGVAYVDKLDTLAKLLDRAYSCNKLYTGIGVTATEMGILGKDVDRFFAK